ncbi:MAG: exodeoxyribonuclease VII large subunit [bacterium]|nr:exodeoxyribonuclease VII large subunit [bacterium]
MMHHSLQDSNSLSEPLRVSEFTKHLQRLVEDTYEWVQIQGEISNFKKAPSGHAYFSLKDRDAVLNCVAWKTTVVRWSSLDLDDGMEVIAGGKITIYPPRGQYQFVVSAIRLAGIGALQHRFDALKRLLAEEGLFDDDRKKALPPMPQRIAVITSPTGAAIRDFINVFRRARYPVTLTVCPVLVQGEKAAAEIAAMIEKVNAYPHFDLIVLCRGGGSLEDLWAFNEECVARAITASKIPVLTGIGHEIDFTIADFVADLRASTPTAAAQVICRGFDEQRGEFLYWADRLPRAILPQLQRKRQEVEGMRKALLRSHPLSVIMQNQQRLDEWQAILTQAMRMRLQSEAAAIREGKKHLDRQMRHGMERHAQQITKFRQLLQSYDPQKTLNRGFSICYDAEGRIVTAAKEKKPGDALRVRLAQGALTTQVTKVVDDDKEQQDTV